MSDPAVHAPPHDDGGRPSFPHNEGVQPSFPHGEGVRPVLPGDGGLRILHDDGVLLAVHKPPGLLVHRSPLDAAEADTVQRRLKAQLGAWLLPVHRLDKGTSGLLLARTPAAARAAGLAFQTQSVAKRYLAFVRGWPPESVTLDHPLRPEDTPPEAPPLPACSAFARLARLELASSVDGRHPRSRYALVEARPFQGRRHQIRRHLKHLAHPIVGDATHGKGLHNRWWAARLGLGRLWLHALSLGLPHPDGGWLSLHAPLREDEGWAPLAAQDGWAEPWPRAEALAAGPAGPDLPPGLPA